MTDKRARMKGRRTNAPFLMLPIEVLRSPAFVSLSFRASRLLLDLGQQHNGTNNGDLSAAWGIMHARGWNSRDTLGRALRELLDSGLIERTRQGGRHRCSLYALTWRGIDACGGKLDVRPTVTPSGLWRRPKNNLVTRWAGQCSPPAVSMERRANAN